MSLITSYILKRSRCLNSQSEPRQTVRYETVKTLMKDKDDKKIVKIAEDFIDGLMSVKEASKNYDKALTILGYFDEANIECTSYFFKLNEMMYYIDNIDQFISWTGTKRISDMHQSVLDENAACIGLVDRIANNCRILTNKYKFEDTIKQMQHRDMKDIVEHCATLMNRFDMKEYQRMNMVIEQLVFISAKDNIKFKGDIMKSVAEYYLINTKESKDNIFRVLTESPLVTQDDLEEINVMIEAAENTDENYITKSVVNLTNYLLLGRPAEGGDEETVKHLVYHTIEGTSLIDIQYNINSLIDYFGKIYSEETRAFTSECFKAIIAALDNKQLDMVELKIIRDVIKANDVLTKFKDTKFADNVNMIINALTDMIQLRYSKENLAAMMVVNAKSDTTIPLKEFKLFKNGLFKAIINLDKYLAGKEKKLIKAVKPKIASFKNKVTSVLFGEATYMKENIYSYIGPDNKIDVCVRQYDVEEFGGMETAKEFAESVIKEFNSMLDIGKNFNIRAYYTLTENIAEIHIKDATTLELSELEQKLVNEADDPAMELYYQIIESIEEVYMTYNDRSFVDLSELISYDNVRENCKGLTKEGFNAILEALKYIDVSKEQVEDFVCAYNDIQYDNSFDEEGNINESATVEESSIDWKHCEEIIPLEVSLEAFCIISTIIKGSAKQTDFLLSESSVEDRMKAKGYTWDDDDEEDEDDDDDEDEEDNKKSASKKKATNKPTEKPSKKYGKGEDLPKGDEKKKTRFDLNSAILATKGLAGKVKHYSGRVKETMMNLDNSIKSCIKALKDADSNERREQIIKGSLIPSFSRCIKFGLVLIGLGVASGGVVAPIIAAIGGIAMDKRLTKKEKVILMDEIETELEVIDKELAMADQNNQLNKYRALLRYKKDLQRQYQRLRYNVRAGMDAGMFAADVGDPTRSASND